MDGVTQANYALSYMANVGIQQPQPWPAQQQKPAKDVGADPQKGVGAVEGQYPEIGPSGRPASAETQQLPGVRPEDVGAKVISSVDGDTITISAEGQSYVQKASATADTEDVKSATAKVEEERTAFGQPFGQPYGDARTETRFDQPQGGGIERAEYEQPEVQQIQNAANEAQDEERVTAQFQPQEKDQAGAVEKESEEKETEKETENDTVEKASDFLRQYFNSELRQMLMRGQISQKQYDDEMKSRQNENDQRIDRKVV